MWICLNRAFFSVVAQRDSDLLVVRARRAGDIEAVFEVPAVATPDRDYAFRAVLERDVVASVLMVNVLAIDYGNFKDSVKESRLKSAYSRVWSVMAGLQALAPWSGVRRASRVPQRPLWGDSADMKQLASGFGGRDADYPVA
jgi:hypothetical protein